MSNADFLMHFGVKGMKWGRRKNRNLKEKKKPLLSLNVKKNLVSLGVLGLFIAPEIGRIALHKLADLNNARQAAAATKTVLDAIGGSKIESLVKGADGVWRLL